MRISVDSGERRIVIPFPTSVIFNDLTAVIGEKAMWKYAHNKAEVITADQLKRLFKEFRRIKRKYGKWVLVDVRSADGQTVKITL